MGDYTHSDLKVVGRHVPDPGSGPFQNAQEAQAAGYDTLNPVTGMYELGVEVDGAFVPLIVEKASLVFDRIQLAKQQRESEQSSQTSGTSDGQSQV
jgi:hypothetical protein